MTFLPTDPGVMVVVVHSRSGWDGYDRGIRDHMNDARPGDPYGQTYRWHRALTLAWLYGLPGGRYNPTEDSHVGGAATRPRHARSVRKRAGAQRRPHVHRHAIPRLLPKGTRMTDTCVHPGFSHGVPATGIRDGDCARNGTVEKHVPPVTATPGWSLDLTPEAKNTLHAMYDRVNAIRSAYGVESKEHAEAAGSLARSLVSMINLGGRISKDGDLSLFGSNEFIAYGVNFSRANRSDEWPANLLGTWSVNS